MSLVLNGVLALGEGVPQLDRLVAGTRDNLPVVGREGHTHDILGVILKAASGLAGAKVPQAKGFVPRPGEGKVSVRGQNDIRDEVAVTLETLLGDTVVL